MKRFFILIPFLIFLVSCGDETVETGDNFEAVTLPDSSVVYLNHNSKISYDEDFEERIVNLEGEAFFDVVPGDTRFKVVTENGEVEVEGTSFNVVSIKTDINVEVVTGIVHLHSHGHKHKLRAGQHGFFHPGNKGITISRAKHRHNSWLDLLVVDLKIKGFHPGKGHRKWIKGNNGRGNNSIKFKSGKGGKVHIKSHGGKGNGHKGKGNKGKVKVKF
ncbi:FecR family protein [Marinigracilibium pacificum]|uniref:FecR domain-containing protein n=1 Tax=Marinigracilibium pacificum TaxID=2729599 RepID=A0A848IS81_9BACT|nr:FecR family protein [Marinigracilibium pacificum]NMM47207.1 FecR domain-containing protein [Marinigracilibium pacificum]